MNVKKKTNKKISFHLLNETICTFQTTAALTFTPKPMNVMDTMSHIFSHMTKSKFTMI